MEKYTLDPQLISLERFLELTRSKKMIPSRVLLQENIRKRFRALEACGIATMGQLIGALGNREKIGTLSTSTGIPENYLILLKREAASYTSKPIPLSEIPGIPFEFKEVLKSRGISNTREYFEKVQTAGQRKEVSAVTGIPESRLKEIYSLCDLSRITGVGGLYSRIIFDSGIRSTREFADTDVWVHHRKYLEVIEKYGYPAKPLSVDDLQYCINYARVIVEMNPSPK